MSQEYLDPHDGTRRIDDFRKDMLPILINGRDNLTCGECRSDDSEDGTFGKIESRTSSPAKSKCKISYFAHFGIEVLVSVRVELHGIGIDFWIVQHVPNNE